MLPTKKSQAKKKIEDYSILLYGNPKVGKSSFCSEFPSPLFIATEPGLNALSVHQVPVTTWEEFLNVCSEIAQGNHDFKTIVIDTVDNLYRCCADHCSKTLKVTHESDMDWGKGYQIYKDEFFRALKKLALLNFGLVLISHVTLKEIKTRTLTYNRAMPTLPKHVREPILGWVDIIMYADIVEDRRILRIKADSKDYVAGDRSASLFGAMKDEVPLDYSEFSKEFYNRGVK